MKSAKNTLLLLFVGAVFLTGYGYGRWYRAGAEVKTVHAQTTQSRVRRILYYVDPMHPAYKSDKPGIAPDCGMKLVPVYADGRKGDEPTDAPLVSQGTQHTEQPSAEGHPAKQRKVLYWKSSMIADFRSDKPGKDPMGMDLVPVYADDSASAGSSAGMPIGTIKITPRKQQLIGITYGTAELESGIHTFRAVGKVDYDERRIARVHARVDGWIERVFVDFIGKKVAKGQPLLTIYSPDLVATQQEYLLALKGRQGLKHSTLPEAVTQSESLVSAARERLELWEFSDAQIDEVARTGKPLTYVTLYSPISGYVTARNAFPKQKITPDTELYTVADLGNVWIMADVFEYEAPRITVGQHVSVNISYMPGKTFTARVNYIQPEVDPATRTLKVRLESPNPELLLKPNMYVDVEFRVPAPRRITVPTQAVLDSGLRKTVFVDRGNGFLEPREVETGERIGDRIEIRKGLAAGERIVTSGNFLVDSESALQSALAGMGGDEHGGTVGSAKPVENERHSAPAQQPGEETGVLPQGHQGHQQ